MSHRETGSAIPAVVVIAAITLLVYIGSLSGGFVYDDHHAIVQNPHLRDIGNLPAFFHRPDMFSVDPANAMYRPLLLTTFALDHWCHGLHGTWGWHLTSLMLHILTACALLGLLRRLDGRRSSPWGWPFFGALLFALHPIHAETVNYLSARSSLLATLGTVWAFYSYVRAQSETAPGARRSWQLGSALAFLAALLAKEIAIVLPAILLVYEGLLNGNAVRRVPRAAAARYVPFLLIGIAYLFWRKLMLGTATATVSLAGQGDPLSGAGRGFLPNLFTQAEVLFLYLRLLIWPSDSSVDHAVPVVETLTDPLAWTAAGVVLAAAIAAFRWRHRCPLFVLGLVWFAAALAPTSLIPLNVIANEHRLYLPTVGLLIAGTGLAGRWGRLPGRRASRLALGCAVLVALGWQSLRRTDDWRGELTLWASAVETDPGSHRAQLNYGNALAQRGDFVAALEHYRSAVRIHPSYGPARINVSEALVRVADETGDATALAEAAEQLRKVLERRPHDRLLPLKLARVLQRRYELAGSPDDASRQHDVLLAALAAAPRDVATRRSVAEHFEARAEWAAAARHYQALRDLRPDATLFAYRAADLWVRAGEHELAVAALERLVAERPFEVPAHRELAELYPALEPPRPDLAARHARIAEKLSPAAPR